MNLLDSDPNVIALFAERSAKRERCYYTMYAYRAIDGKLRYYARKSHLKGAHSIRGKVATYNPFRDEWYYHSSTHFTKREMTGA